MTDVTEIITRQIKNSQESGIDFDVSVTDEQRTARFHISGKRALTISQSRTNAGWVTPVIEWTGSDGDRPYADAAKLATVCILAQSVAISWERLEA